MYRSEKRNVGGMEVSSLLPRPSNANGNILPFRRNGSSRNNNNSRGWLVALSLCAISFIIVGLSRVSSIFYVDYMKAFHVNRRIASTPFSVQRATTKFFGPVVGILGQMFSVRALTMTGGLMAAVSAIGCAFIPNIIWITIFWGDLFGIATAFAVTLNQSVINMYFQKNRSSASGLSYAGGSLGAMVLPYIVDHVLDEWGVKNTYMAMAFLFVLIIPIAVLLKNPPTEREEDAIEFQSPGRNKDEYHGLEGEDNEAFGEGLTGPPQNSTSFPGGGLLEKLPTGGLTDLKSTYGSIASGIKNVQGALGEQKKASSNAFGKGILGAFAKKASKEFGEGLTGPPQNSTSFPGGGLLEKLPTGGLTDLKSTYGSIASGIKNVQGALGEPKKASSNDFGKGILGAFAKKASKEFLSSKTKSSPEDVHSGYDVEKGEEKTPLNPKGILNAKLKEGFFAKIYTSVVDLLKDMFVEPKEDVNSQDKSENIAGEDTAYYQQGASRQEDFDVVIDKRSTSAIERNEKQFREEGYQTGCIMCKECGKPFAPPSSIRATSKEMETQSDIGSGDEYGLNYAREASKKDGELYHGDSLTTVSERDETQSLNDSATSRKSAAVIEKNVASFRTTTDIVTTPRIEKELRSQKLFEVHSDGNLRKQDILHSKAFREQSVEMSQSSPIEEPQVDVYSEAFSSDLEEGIASESQTTNIAFNRTLKGVQSSATDEVISPFIKSGREHESENLLTEKVKRIVSSAEDSTTGDAFSTLSQSIVTSRKIGAAVIRKETPTSVEKVSVVLKDDSNPFSLSISKGTIEGREMSSSVSDFSIQPHLTESGYTITELETGDISIPKTRVEFIEGPEGVSSSTKRFSVKSSKTQLGSDSSLVSSVTSGAQTIKSRAIKSGTKIVKAAEFEHNPKLQKEISELAESISTFIDSSATVKPQITDSEYTITTETIPDDETLSKTVKIIKGPTSISSTTKKFTVKGSKMLTKTATNISSELAEAISALEGSSISVTPQITEQEYLVTETETGPEEDENQTKTIQYIEGPNVVNLTTKTFVVKGGQTFTKSATKMTSSASEAFSTLTGTSLKLGEIETGSEEDNDQTKTIQYIEGPNVVTSTTRKFVVKGGQTFTKSATKMSSSASEAFSSLTGTSLKLGEIETGSEEDNDQTKTIQYIEGPNVVTSTTRKFVVKGGQTFTKSATKMSSSASEAFSSLTGTSLKLGEIETGSEEDNDQTKTIQYIEGPNVVTSTTRKFVVKGGQTLTKSATKMSSSVSEALSSLTGSSFSVTPQITDQEYIITETETDPEGNETLTKTVQFIEGPKMVKSTTEEMIVKGSKILKQSATAIGSTVTESISSLASSSFPNTPQLETENIIMDMETDSAGTKITQSNPTTLETKVLSEAVLERNQDLQFVSVPLDGHSRQFFVKRGSQEVAEDEDPSAVLSVSSITKNTTTPGIIHTSTVKSSSSSEAALNSDAEACQTQGVIEKKIVTFSHSPRTEVNVVEKTEVKHKKGKSHSKKKETGSKSIKSSSPQQTGRFQKGTDSLETFKQEDVLFWPHKQGSEGSSTLHTSTMEDLEPSNFSEPSINFTFLYQNLNYIIHIIRITELLQSGESYSPQRFQSLFSEKSELRRALKFFFFTIEESATDASKSHPRHLPLFQKDSKERKEICRRMSVSDLEKGGQDMDANFKNQYIYTLFQMVFQENESTIASNFPDQDHEHVLKIIQELKKLVQHCRILESRYSIKYITQTATTTGSETKEKPNFKTAALVTQRAGKTKSGTKSKISGAVEEGDSSAERSVYLYCSEHSFQASTEVKKMFDNEAANQNPTDSPPINLLWKEIKAAVTLHSNFLFLLVCLSRVVHFFTFTGVIAVIVDYGLDRGIRMKDGLFLLSTMSFGDFLGCLCSGWITDMGVMSIETFMSFTMVLQGILSMAFNWTSPKHLYLITTLYSISQGAVYVRHPVLMCKYIKNNQHSVGLGFINLGAGILGFGLPYYIGYFRDTLGSYNQLFLHNGVFCIFLGFLWSLVPCYLRLKYRYNGFVN